jgi:hypothetical protein
MTTQIRDEITITMADAQEAVLDILRPKLVPNLISPPGVGKSDLAAHIAKKYGLFLIDVRLSSADPADLNGFPMILKNTLNKAEGQIKAGYIPMNTFPIEGDPVPEGYRGWLLLLDEFNSAILTVQAASYKLVLDRMVGMYNLHKRCLVMAAGNRMGDKAIVNRLSTAMQSRVITLQIRVCREAWQKWANGHDVDHRVKSFIEFQPDLLHNFDPNHQEVTFPCPRTWEFMSKIIKPWDSIHMRKLATMAGTVGEGAARQFFAYTEIFEHIPTIEQILDDPEFCQLGDEPSMHFALMGLISHHMKAENADPLIKFLNRMDIDMQVCAIRAGVANDRAVKKTQNFKRWIAVNGDELL